jgi:glycosyltransferase involved in cell wall biosynthesis
LTGALVIDARWLRTGIGRYTLSLLHGVRDKLRNIFLTCIAQPQDVEEVSAFCDRVLPCDVDIYGVREQLALPVLARTASAFYAPHYNIPVMWRRKLLVTIHDLNHLLDATYRGTWKSRLYAEPLLKLAVRKADVIVTPSAYTKAKLSQHLGVEPSRISVIPCCVASCFQSIEKKQARTSVAHKLAITQPYLLFVGNCAPNKNIPLLLDSVARLTRRRADAPVLLVAGNDSKWQPRMSDYARDLGIQGKVVWLGKLSDGLLAELYAAALMTIMPSFEEGFGLPVIESMACGTPVICSEAASLPEVAGDAALYFSPYSCEQLSDTIERVMDSTGIQEKLIAAGLARLSLFSPEGFAARQASAIYKLMFDQ